MNKRAQASLEYLMTYGWMLILIATIIGVLVFMIDSPTESVVFSSSNQTKLAIKGSTLDASGNVEVLIKNLTGGKIKVTSFYTGGDFAGGKLNGFESTVSSLVEIPAGGELFFTEINYVGLGSVDGTIAIEYTDFANLSQTAVISGKGSAAATAEPVSSCQILEAGKKYVLSQDISTTASSACITLIGDNVVLNCNGKKITGPDGSVSIFTSRGISANSAANFTISNCEVSDFGNDGIFLYQSPGSRITNVTASNNYRYGLFLYSCSDSILADSKMNNNGNSGLVVSNTVSSSGSFALINSEAKDNAFNGVMFFYLDNGSVMRNNEISGGLTHGSYFNQVTGTTISNNNIANSGMAGILLVNVTNTTLTGNTLTKIGVDDPNWAGIYIASGSGNKLNNNKSCGNNSVNDLYCTDLSVSSGSGNIATNVNCPGLETSSECP